ncbi:MAG: plastocyanin/azurin family copper-binding protein [Microthrixaceae bacterium]
MRFVFTNRGTLTHEAFIGDEADQAAHEREMNASSSEGSTDAPTTRDAGRGTVVNTTGPGNAMATPARGPVGSVTLAPGQAVALPVTFEQAGLYLIGCHEPGHWAAGMRATIIVR